MIKKVVCVLLCAASVHPLTCMNGKARELSRKESKEEIKRAIQEVLGQNNPKMEQPRKPLLHKAFALAEKALADNTAPVDGEAEAEELLLRIHDTATQGWER